MCILPEKKFKATRERINELGDGCEEITQSTAQRDKDIRDEIQAGHRMGWESPTRKADFTEGRGNRGECVTARR